jgi:hypothetical protein
MGEVVQAQMVAQGGQDHERIEAFRTGEVVNDVALLIETEWRMQSGADEADDVDAGFARSVHHTPDAELLVFQPVHEDAKRRGASQWLRRARHHQLSGPAIDGGSDPSSMYIAEVPGGVVNTHGSALVPEPL